MCSIEGPLWKQSLNYLPLFVKMRLARVNRQIDVDHLIDNIAAAYDAIEKRIVETIDDLYGAEPEWLIHL